MKYEELSKEVSYALRHAPWEYERAYEDGVVFYHGNEKVWLADKIPACYIKEL